MLNLDYSTKNITYPSLDSYVSAFTCRNVDFINRPRWKDFFFNQRQNNSAEKKENFGLKSQRMPPADQNLKKFEFGFFVIIRNLQFKESSNSFEDLLRRDVKRIQRSKNAFMKPDKETTFTRYLIRNTERF